MRDFLSVPLLILSMASIEGYVHDLPINSNRLLVALAPLSRLCMVQDAHRMSMINKIAFKSGAQSADGVNEVTGDVLDCWIYLR